MEKFIISPDFTIDDIRKIREYNYNIIKDMTPQEKRDYYNKHNMVVYKQILYKKILRTKGVGKDAKIHT